MPSNPNRSDVEISDVQLSVEEVELCLAGLDSSKASGPDGIPAHILKQSFLCDTTPACSPLYW